MNKELVFDVEQDEGIFVATCHNPEMATQGETLEQLIVMKSAALFNARDLFFDGKPARIAIMSKAHFATM